MWGVDCEEGEEKRKWGCRGCILDRGELGVMAGMEELQIKTGLRRVRIWGCCRCGSREGAGLSKQREEGRANVLGLWV